MNYRKISWFLGITVVFLIVLATNLIDQNSFRKVRDSTVSIYEDRLSSKNLLFDLVKLISEKDLANANADTTFYLARNGEVNVQIHTLLTSFRDSDLTQKEIKYLDLLDHGLTKLEKLEVRFLQDSIAVDHVAIAEKLDILKKRLNSLAEIQMQEGRTQMEMAKSAVDSAELLAEIELYFLIFLFGAVLLIVLTSGKRKKKTAG
ncbi:MAG: hypothetical protein AAGN35_05250 [Bacteroidota bacterium]